MAENKELEAQKTGDEENPEQEPAPVSKKKKGWKFYLILIVAQLVVAMVLVKFIIYPKYSNWAQQKQLEKLTRKKEPEKQKEMGFTYKISDMTTNPQNSMGTRFAVFEIVLEVPKQEDLDELKKYDPVIRDKFIKYFRSKSVSELSYVSFMDSSKADLKGIVDSILQQNMVEHVYFTRFVLQ